MLHALGVGQARATLPCQRCLSKFQQNLVENERVRQHVGPDASVFTWRDSLRVYSRRHTNPEIRDIEWQSCVRNELAEYMEPDGGAPRPGVYTV